MLKKLVIAGAMVTAAAGMGLATPAYATQANGGDHDGVKVTCQGPTFGEEESHVSVGDASLLSRLSLLGDSSKDLMHSQDSLEFDYKCGNGSITDIGNKVVRITH